MVKSRTLWILSILMCYSFYVCHCGSLPPGQIAEQTLINSLLNSNYSKNIRPDTQVYVDVTAELQQIINIDEKLQIMTSSSFITQTWTDSRLSWTPGAANNYTEVLMLPVKSLWIPDTMILNSADTSGYFTISDYSLVSVNYSGQVAMILPALSVKTRCTLNVQKFPFDQQMCSINITSWAQGSNRLVYTETSDLIDISEYMEHPVWKLLRTDLNVYHADDRAPFEDTYNDVIAIELFLQRKPLFFMVNGIFACLVLNCVTLLSYSLPFGSQIGLCMTCFMTYSVYSLNFSNLFPQQSQYLMTITLYFLLSMCYTLVSMSWFILCNHYTSKNEMPKLLHIFAEFLQRTFVCCFSKPKDEKKEAKKDVAVENGDLKKIEDKSAIPNTNDGKMACICCQKLFIPCLRKRNRVETVDQTSSVIVGDEDAAGKKATEINPAEATAPASNNETQESPKPKCDFCNRCESCQADFDKDKTKGKNKKDIEAKCSALNYFVFLFILLFMFIANMAIWITMSQ